MEIRNLTGYISDEEHIRALEGAYHSGETELFTYLQGLDRSALDEAPENEYDRTAPVIPFLATKRSVEAIQGAIAVSTSLDTPDQQ